MAPLPGAIAAAGGNAAAWLDAALPKDLSRRYLRPCLGVVSLPGRHSRGLTRVTLAFLVRASFSPLCEIRQLAVIMVTGGINALGPECHVVFYGHRGRPVKKPRFFPAQLAHQLALKLHARRLGTLALL